MTATLISLLSILLGIIGANLYGALFKKYSFQLIGNTISGVFGSIILIKSFEGLGFGPASIVVNGSTNWFLFLCNIIISVCGGILAVIIMKRVQLEMQSEIENKNRMIALFKIISILEGISYILLLLIGVPLKYIAGNDILVKSLGMPHGLLFIAYIIIALLIRSQMKWNAIQTLIVLIASLLPFGTFYINRKYFKK